MSNSFKWGDKPALPTSSPTRLPVVASRKRSSGSDPSIVEVAESQAREAFSPLSPITDYNLSASILDELIEKDMNNHPPRSPTLAVSTDGWTFDNLLSRSDNFCPIPRVAAWSKSDQLSERIKTYEEHGEPLIIEGWHEDGRWPHAKFSPEYFTANTEPDVCIARNVHTWADKEMALSDLIEVSRRTPVIATPNELERLYGKDALCPSEWEEWLRKGQVIPTSLLPDGPNDLFRFRPASERVETLMCYLGIGDTFTPCHKDLCASSGQNLMCYSENGGSSYWFMTQSSDAPAASAYFKTLNQELDHENHVITVEELAKAPFRVYIAEQKLGDLVLVPPRSCHQVINCGGITIKTSWSRMTLRGLKTAYYHELPIYRRVCRPEIYRVKSTIHYTLLHYTQELRNIINVDVKKFMSHNSTPTTSRSSSPRTVKYPVSNSRKEPRLPLAENHYRTHLVDVLSQLVALYSDVLCDEYSPDYSQPKQTSHEKQGYTERIACDFCGADVFQSFFECRECGERDNEGNVESGYIVCPGCYVEGRSCKHEVMEPMQCHSFDLLIRDRSQAVKTVNEHITNTAARCGRKTRFGLISEGIDLSPTEPLSGTFRAACILQQRRISPRQATKTCTLSKGSHIVPFTSALTCKNCHSAKCFTHSLTEQRIHAVEAILAHYGTEGKPNTEKLHQLQLTGRQRLEQESGYLLECQKIGSRPNLQLQLVHVALEYGLCRPINSTSMKAGWYDIIIQEVTEDPEMPTSHFGSPLTSCPSTPISSTSDLTIAETIPNVLDSVSQDIIPRSEPTSPRKRKRKAMDCVLVPSAGYSIHRKAASAVKPMATQFSVETTTSISVVASASSTQTLPESDVTDPSPNVPRRFKKMGKKGRMFRRLEVDNEATDKSMTAIPQYSSAIVENHSPAALTPNEMHSVFLTAESAPTTLSDDSIPTAKRRHLKTSSSLPRKALSGRHPGNGEGLSGPGTVAESLQDALNKANNTNAQMLREEEREYRSRLKKPETKRSPAMVKPSEVVAPRQMDTTEALGERTVPKRPVRKKPAQPKKMAPSIDPDIPDMPGEIFEVTGVGDLRNEESSSIPPPVADAPTEDVTIGPALAVEAIGATTSRIPLEGSQTLTAEEQRFREIEQENQTLKQQFYQLAQYMEAMLQTSSSNNQRTDLIPNSPDITRDRYKELHEENRALQTQMNQLAQQFQMKLATDQMQPMNQALGSFLGAIVSAGLNAQNQAQKMILPNQHYRPHPQPFTSASKSFPGSSFSDNGPGYRTSIQRPRYVNAPYSVSNRGTHKYTSHPNPYQTTHRDYKVAGKTNRFHPYHTSHARASGSVRRYNTSNLQARPFERRSWSRERAHAEATESESSANGYHKSHQKRFIEHDCERVNYRAMGDMGAKHYSARHRQGHSSRREVSVTSSYHRDPSRGPARRVTDAREDESPPAPARVASESKGMRAIDREQDDKRDVLDHDPQIWEDDYDQEEDEDTSKHQQLSLRRTHRPHNSNDQESLSDNPWDTS
ncbi:hypothetical protein BDQ12DRAFT_676151 [Crucibulum laeve]|uniref:JmjC domain-containing protein n=1 Tax=Crucibulum laeve TaxID=68775 RepID=A0A5C3MDC7_9AGAR|nr:hypothetical protein BDQ12DRAFT_676151 [Crucibulum laeve]